MRGKARGVKEKYKHLVLGARHWELVKRLKTKNQGPRAKSQNLVPRTQNQEE